MRECAMEYCPDTEQWYAGFSLVIIGAVAIDLIGTTLAATAEPLMIPRSNNRRRDATTES